MKEIIITSNAPEPVGPYNQAIKAGNTVYISGQIAINPETGDLVMNTSLVSDLEASEALTPEELNSLHIPVRGLYGTNSDIRHQVARLEQHLPDFQVRYLEGCTHSVLWEATEEVISGILSWLEERE